jgi:hypothetical protein
MLRGNAMTDTARDDGARKLGSLHQPANHLGGATAFADDTAFAEPTVFGEATVFAEDGLSEDGSAEDGLRALTPSSGVAIAAHHTLPVHAHAAQLGPRSGAEPESGVHQAVNLPFRSPSAGSDVNPALDLLLLGVTETQVPPGWVSPDEELACHELTVIVRGSQGTLREEGEASSGPVEALLLKSGVRRQERNVGEVDLHRLRITFHWRSAPAELTETVQDTCGRLHEIAS